MRLATRIVLIQTMPAPLHFAERGRQVHDVAEATRPHEKQFLAVPILHLVEGAGFGQGADGAVAAEVHKLGTEEVFRDVFTRDDYLAGVQFEAFGEGYDFHERPLCA